MTAPWNSAVEQRDAAEKRRPERASRAASSMRRLQLIPVFSGRWGFIVERKTDAADRL